MRVKMCVCVPKHEQIITEIITNYHTHMHPPNNLLTLGYKEPKAIKYK